MFQQSEGLEEEQSKLEQEIHNLQQQKEQLEFLLEAHRPVCTAKGINSVALPVQPELCKEEKPDPICVSTGTATIVITPAVPNITTVPVVATSLTSTDVNLSTTRPSTLPIVTRVMATSGASVVDATGVPISTPSSGLVFNHLGLDSMMNGHTGLTPLTEAASCGSQVHRTVSSDTTSSGSETLSSPTTLMAL